MSKNNKLLNFFNKNKKQEPVFNNGPRELKVKHHVAICIPNSREFISTDSAFSIMALSVPAGLTRSLTTKDLEPINHCRNEMIKEVLNQDGLTHVLMLEPGLRLNPGLLWEIFTIKADIVSVPTFDIIPPYHPNIYKNSKDRLIDFDKHEKEDVKSRSIDIYASDPGCVLIDKKVFEKIDTPFMYPQNNYYRSDMFNFTSKARELGFKVKATTKLWQDRMATLQIGYQFFSQHREYKENKKINDIDIKDI